MNIVDVIRSFAGFAWLAAVGLGVFAVTRAARNQNAKRITSSATVMLGLALLLTILGAGLVFIEPNERGVIESQVFPGLRLHVAKLLGDDLAGVLAELDEQPRGRQPG